MIKFILGVIVGLYICENYDYSFSTLIEFIDSLLDTKRENVS